MFNLFRYFSIASAIAFIIVTAMVVFSFDRYATNELLATAERQNVILASFIANDLRDRLPEHYDVVIHGAKDLKRMNHQRHIDRTDAILKRLIKELPVLKIEIFRDALVIYSKDRREIGKVKSSRRFNIALDKRIPSSKLFLGGKSKAYDEALANRDIIETYVPVGTIETAASIPSSLMVEIYTDVTPLVSRITQTKTNIIAGLLVIFGAFYGALILIVRRADGVLHQQYNDLSKEIVERKEAEEKYKKSQNRLHGAIESLQEGFVLYDADDRIVIVNDVFRRINTKVDEYLKLGVRFEDMIRANVESGRIVEAIGREEEFIRERLEQHRNPKGQIIRQFNDGKWYIIKETRTPEGGIAITFSDITELQSAKEARERLSQAVETVPVGIALFDSDDRLVFFNNRYGELMEVIADILKSGATFEEMLRTMVERQPVKDARGREEEFIQERIKHHRNPTGPFDIRRENIWLLANETRLADGSIFVIITDITERKRAEETTKRLAAAIDGLSENFALYGPDDRLVICNQGYRKLNEAIPEAIRPGVSYEEHMRAVMAKGLAPKAKGREEDYIRERMEQHRNPTGPYEVIRLDRVWLVHEQRVADGSTATIATDITERKRMVEALVASEEKHRHFSADVAHELRTPLAVLRSHLDNLENTETNQSLIKDVDVMSRLVSQLLATTRLDSLTVNLDDEADLHAIGAEVAKYLAPFAIKEGRSIEMTGTQDPVIVQGNDDALEMAVRNLVENALRYSARETVITIHVSDEPAISVINYGRGIPPEQQKVIFRRFKRADRRSGGAGLGLSIVQRVVEAHQAAIDVSDAPGGGTVFKISFPSDQSRKVAEV